MKAKAKAKKKWRRQFAGARANIGQNPICRQWTVIRRKKRRGNEMEVSSLLTSSEHKCKKKRVAGFGYDSTSITARPGLRLMSWRIIISLFYANETRQEKFLSESSSVNEVLPKKKRAEPISRS
jgi:hypothetical protein